MGAPIYTVEMGSYDGHRIFGFYLKKADAERIRDKINSMDGEEAYVVPHRLGAGLAELDKGWGFWNVQMRRDGVVERITRDENPWDGYSTERSHIWDRPNAPAYAGKNIPAVLCVSCWAKNSAHATKITNDERLAMIESGEWK